MQENTFINLYMWAQKFENVNLHMEHYLYFMLLAGCDISRLLWKGLKPFNGKGMISIILHKCAVMTRYLYMVDVFIFTDQDVIFIYKLI